MRPSILIALIVACGSEKKKTIYAINENPEKLNFLLRVDPEFLNDSPETFLEDTIYFVSVQDNDDTLTTDYRIERVVDSNGFYTKSVAYADHILITLKPGFMKVDLANEITRLDLNQHYRLEDACSCDAKGLPRLIKVYTTLKSRRDLLDSMLLDPTFKGISGVKSLDRDYIVFGEHSNNEDHRKKQWALADRNMVPGSINIQPARPLSSGSDSIIVGILDSGVDTSHIDLRQSIWTSINEIPGDGLDNDSNGLIDDYNGWNFFHNNKNVHDRSKKSHGTKIAGIIGAKIDDIGVDGVAKNVKMVPLKVFNKSLNVGVSKIICAMYYGTTINNLQILNCSFSTTSNSLNLQEAINFLEAKDILVVTVSGNVGDGLSGCARLNCGNNIDSVGKVYPANYNNQNIVVVTAITEDIKKADFANYGSNTIDIAAPGVNIWSTVQDGYNSGSGTSFAAPFFVGAYVLYKSHLDDLYGHSISQIQVKDTILHYASSHPNLDTVVIKGRYLDVGALERIRKAESLAISMKTD